jgi:hypothetical protein
MKGEPIESSVSSETFQRSMADFLKSVGSKRDNLTAFMKEISKVKCQYGSGVLEDEIRRLLPLQRTVQSTSSGWANDMLSDIPVSDYQKLMEAMAKRVTLTEFLLLFHRAAVANTAQNTDCQ